MTGPFIMQTVIFFGDFINKELSWGRNLASNSLLQLEEMYQDPKFMKKPHAQLNLVKLKRPTLLKYLYYFQEKMPHVTEVHKKMECLLHFLTLNASGSDKNCFLRVVTNSHAKKKKMVEVATSAFEAAHSTLSKYVEDRVGSATKFLD